MNSRDLISKLLGEATPIGRRGIKLRPEDVDQEELAMGRRVELEHTKDLGVAERVALDHLAENPAYYSTLRKAGLADELK